MIIFSIEIFSVWIFIWFILYYLHIININPLFNMLFTEETYYNIKDTVKNINNECLAFNLVGNNELLICI